MEWERNWRTLRRRDAIKLVNENEENKRRVEK